MKDTGNLKKVKVTQDDSGHWYVIPSEDSEQFHKDLNHAYAKDNYDDFEALWGMYRIGGGLNNIQLWAELK